MRAIEIKEPGGPEVLVPTSRPVPVPAGDEVLIRIHAAAVNGPDVFQRKGLYDPPPGASDIPGLEVAGQSNETTQRCDVCEGLALQWQDRRQYDA
jgi:NADPH2:quinone reductase